MNPHVKGSKLAAVTPSGTTAVTAFPATLPTEITRIFVCNVSGSACTFRLFHGADGDSFDTSNALYYDAAVPAGTTVEIFADSTNCGITLEATDILGVRSDTADGLTFSIYGVTAEITPGAG